MGNEANRSEGDVSRLLTMPETLADVAVAMVPIVSGLGSGLLAMTEIHEPVDAKDRANDKINGIRTEIGRLHQADAIISTSPDSRVSDGAAHQYLSHRAEIEQQHLTAAIEARPNVNEPVKDIEGGASFLGLVALGFVVAFKVTDKLEHRFKSRPAKPKSISATS